MITHRIEQRDLVQLKDLLKAVDVDFSFGLAIVSLVLAFIGLLIILGRLLAKGKRQDEGKAILAKLFGFKPVQRNFTKLGLVLIFYRIFFMLCKMLYANSIKTSNTVLETGHFITSLQQLLSSDFVVCFYEDHISLAITIESDRNTTINRLFRQKTDLQSGVNSLKFSSKCVIDLSRLGHPIDLAGKALYANQLLSTITLARYVADNGESNYWWVSFILK